ncbi:uncharacterized protein BcabD6B2_21050 [Babesia caballi]|uniref:Uncharacterized protein n=1 Tax=Babesia caballi TaxID=5871 RepID=A0AAV4LSW3_BABCB|nr:hypothetical protein, conserved [Babesia caballi]
MASKSGKSLTDCPSNLKEAIDWILRVTGKDGGAGKVDELAAEIVKVQDLKQAFTEAVEDMRKKVEVAEKSLDAGPQTKLQLEQRLNDLSGLLTAYEGLKGWLGLGNGGQGKEKLKKLIEKFAEGLMSFMESINEKGISYKRAYVQLSGALSTIQKAGDIFLGCMPMVFFGLSFLCWRCRTNNGEWNDLQFNGGGSHFKLTQGIFQADMRLFTTSLGFSELSSYRGEDVFEKIMKDKFKEFTTANEKSLTSYTGFLRCLQSKLNSAISSQPPTADLEDGHTLVSLYLISSAYFAGQRAKKADQAKNPARPSTIREMLYWLSHLPLNPQFGEFLDHFDKPFPSGPLPIADSGYVGVSGTQYLTADNLRDYIIALCVSAPGVLGSIQGSQNSDPFLHEIYCSPEFLYPSTAPEFLKVLCDYSYALQFQLYFLYTQCYNRSHSSGWRACRYGSTVQPHNKSHICPIISECQNMNCQHNSPKENCKHTDTSEGCGTGSKPSPLQAFLTDKLEGFCRKQSGSVSHLSSCSASSLCHTPMGFAGNIRQDAKQGNIIYRVLTTFCGSPSAPLRQLCEKLIGVTKRMPRTPGDMFGFYWYLDSQLFNKSQIIGDLSTLHTALQQYWTPWGVAQELSNAFTYNRSYALLPTLSATATSSGLSQSIKALKASVALFPFLFQADLPNALHDLASHCHVIEGNTLRHNTKCSSFSISKPDKVGDLCSLSMCNGIDDRIDPNNGLCGAYLEPVVYSAGATYVPSFTPTYLTWIVYLTDEFYESLSTLLDAFNGVTCSTCGRGSSNPLNGPHGLANSCQCKSIPQCADVLPLLYSRGFQFYDAASLTGWDHSKKKHTAASKRKCHAFGTVLSNVLSEGSPLHNLLLAIDNFLYYLRIQFMSLVSTFWLCSLAILLYFIFYGIDVLHFKSHVHFPSSHEVSPIGLLTTGKQLPMTKLRYYML